VSQLGFIFLIQVLEFVFIYVIVGIHLRKEGLPIMKEYLYAPKIVTVLSLEELKKTVKALYKKLLRFAGVVTTHILKKAFSWFRATDKASWLKIYTELLDRDERLDKDVVKIKHTKFALLMKVLNKKDIYKSKESEICYGDYECFLSYRWTNRRGEISHASVGSIGYCTYECKFYYKQLSNSKKVYFPTAKDMIHAVTDKVQKMNDANNLYYGTVGKQKDKSW
jgi:hypothetical protein